MNWMIFGLFAYAAYVLQGGLAPLWTLGERTEPRLLIILLVYVALQASPATVAVAAIILGVLHDIRQTSVPGLVGPWALGYLAAGLRAASNYATCSSATRSSRSRSCPSSPASSPTSSRRRCTPCAASAFLLGQPIADYSAANAAVPGLLRPPRTPPLSRCPVGYLLILSHKALGSYPHRRPQHADVIKPATGR